MTLRRLAVVSPLIFFLHVAEEAPRFVAWFNSLVPRGISQDLFLTVNAVAFTITLFIALAVASSPTTPSALVFTAWVGFLMLANGLFHLVGTIVYARYSPGVATGTLLYLPFGALVLRTVVDELRLKPITVLVVALLGAAPMLAHGYLIVFRGSRLF